MRSGIRFCRDCGKYTLLEACPVCGRASVRPAPMRYSPDDRYGEYRRKAVRDRGDF